MSNPLDIWALKYRPKTLDEYVWRDPQMRLKVEEWLRDGGVPHILLSGSSGTGKSSLAYLVLNLLEIPNEDRLVINASRERKIDDLQDKIINFINMWAFGPSGLKYIFLDEADRMSPLAQGMLRNEIETYSDTCRFILTCNDEKKIVPALHSRFQEIKFNSLNDVDFIGRASDVLNAEHVAFDEEVLVTYYEKTYPDLRKCIGLLQQNTANDVLGPLRDDDEGSTKEYLLQVLDLFRAGKFLAARKWLTDHASLDDLDGIYTFFYKNLKLFGFTEAQQNAALLVIRKGMIYDATAADKELNLAACLIELSMIGTAS
jgi:DNA polymerase III delta prime subunit